MSWSVGFVSYFLYIILSKPSLSGGLVQRSVLSAVTLLCFAPELHKKIHVLFSLKVQFNEHRADVTNLKVLPLSPGLSASILLLTHVYITIMVELVTAVP